MLQKIYNSLLIIILFLTCVMGFKILWDQPATRAEFQKTVIEIVDVIID